MVWGYTPRELAGWMTYLALDKKREAAFQLGVQSLASNGDAKAVKKAIKDLEG